MSSHKFTHNPIKRLKQKLREYDGSGPAATSTLNFRGESNYQSGWPAVWFALGNLVVLLRLAQFFWWMFTF